MDKMIVKSHSILKPLMELTISERRVFDFALQYYDSRPEALNPRFFEVPVSVFRESFPEYATEKPGKVYDYCVEAIKKINLRTLVPDPDVKEDIFWFSKLKLQDDTIVFTLSPEAVPYFLNLKDHYIAYRLANVNRLTKPNSWNLYEYLKEKYLNGERPKWTVTVVDLRERLGANDKYPRFGDFDNYCIKGVKSDIKKLTDIGFDYIKIKNPKDRKKIIKIEFSVYKNNPDPDVFDLDPPSLQLKQELAKAAINPEITKLFIKAAEEQGRIEEILELIPKLYESHKKGGKKPWASYLTGTLRKELLSQTSSQVPKESAVKTPQKIKSSLNCVEIGDIIFSEGVEVKVLHPKYNALPNGSIAGLHELTTMLREGQIKICKKS